MRGEMEIMDMENRRISVLMAVYDPDERWLDEQLGSIDEQDYGNVSLYIYDDASADPVPEAWIKERMKHVPFRYERSSVNMGATKAFEHLIGMAEGDFIAFCDQDDIWEKNKLSRLIREFDNRENGTGARVTLAYSTLSVIDSEGRFIAGDIREIRKHDRFYHGTGLTKSIFVVCGIYGNSLLVPADIAKTAVPFAEGFSHDHWMSLWAAHCGEIRFVEEPLVRYRRHGDNQSNVYRKLRTRDDYIHVRVENQIVRCGSALERLTGDEACGMIAEISDWTKARRAYLTGDLSRLPAVIRGAHFSPRAAIFELCGAPVDLLHRLKDFG